MSIISYLFNKVILDNPRLNRTIIIYLCIQDLYLSIFIWSGILYPFILLFPLFVTKNSVFKYHLVTLHFPITVFVWLCRQGRMLRITLGHCTVGGGPAGYLAAILDLRAGRFTFTSSSIFTMYSTFPQYLKIIRKISQ